MYWEVCGVPNLLENFAFSSAIALAFAASAWSAEGLSEFGQATATVLVLETCQVDRSQDINGRERE